MIPFRIANLLSVAAFACLTVAFLRDLGATHRDRNGGPEGTGTNSHPGLPWIRAGTLGLWAGLLIRAGWPSSAPGGFPSWDLVPTLAFTALLHLIHIHGWKGSRARRAGLCCYGVAFGAFALALAGAIR